MQKKSLNSWLSLYKNLLSTNVITNNVPVLGGLARAYVEAIRQGAVPCIENAVRVTAQLENERAIANCLLFYRNW